MRYVLIVLLMLFTSCSEESTSSPSGSDSSILKAGFDGEIPGTKISVSMFNKDLQELIKTELKSLKRISYSSHSKSLTYSIKPINDINRFCHVEMKLSIIECNGPDGNDLLDGKLYGYVEGDKRKSLEISSDDAQVYLKDKPKHGTSGELVFQVQMDCPKDAQIYKLDMSREGPYELDLGPATLKVEDLSKTSATVLMQKPYSLVLIPMSGSEIVKIGHTGSSVIETETNVFEGVGTSFEKEIDALYVVVMGEPEAVTVKEGIPLIDEKLKRILTQVHFKDLLWKKKFEDADKILEANKDWMTPDYLGNLLGALTVDGDDDGCIYLVNKGAVLDKQYSRGSLLDFCRGDKLYNFYKEKGVKHVLSHPIMKNIYNLEKVKEIVAKDKSSVNFKDKDGNSPLHYAYSNYDLAKFLLDNGADIKAVNKENETVFRDFRITPKVAKLYVENGVDLDVSSTGSHPRCPLEKRYESKEIIKILVEGGAEVNTPRGALFLLSDYDACLYLINNTDIDVKKINDRGQNFIGFKVMWNRLSLDKDHDKLIELIKAGIKKGVDINHRDNDGKTALDYADESEKFSKSLKALGAKTGKELK